MREASYMRGFDCGNNNYVVARSNLEAGHLAIQQGLMPDNIIDTGVMWDNPRKRFPPPKPKEFREPKRLKPTYVEFTL